MPSRFPSPQFLPKWQPTTPSATSRRHRQGALLIALAWFAATPVAAADQALDTLVDPATAGPNRYIEEVTIVGSREAGRRITGSAHYLGSEELEQLGHTDIQRVLRAVPGVSIQVEDGYGLRPNISIRGVATERSGRITLLEDNVLIAPAPYSAPSAYYFPTMARMQAIEVVKGPAAITQGPYTIGGALNMVSTQIPTESRGVLTAEAGQDSTYRLHASYGNRYDNGVGFLLETHQWASDGFQSIDRVGGSTGLDVADYTAKISFAPTDSRHALELKLQYTEQDSDQSYLGLTDADFADDAFRRYGLSALDNIDTEHSQVILRYDFAVNDRLNLSVTGYNNEHERDWFKTEGIDFDGSSDAQSFSRTSWFNVVQAINSGESLQGNSAADLQAVLDGSADTAPGSIQLRSNAREYYSRGIQFKADWQFELGNSQHSLEFGIRYHEDEEDRLQRNSTYHQENGLLVLDDLGLLGNAGNRVQQAEAVAIHVYDQIELGKLTLTPGLRYEDIDQSRTRWETRSSRTDNPGLRGAANVRDTRANQTRVWLPGVGAIYQASEQLAFVAGVHKGFTAPSNAPGVDEETAVNYEAGIRYTSEQLSLEAIYFLSDYDNLLGECTASSGSDCQIGDAFNGDAATVHGLEFGLSTDLAGLVAPSTRPSIRLPVQFTYSYINAEFDTDIADTDFFGNVSEGDPIPYIPDHQFTLSAGIEGNRWAAYLSANYVDEVCVRASCGAFEQTDDAFTVDLAGNFDLSNTVNLFARVENLFGAEDIMGRQPYGARPNKDTTASLGVRVNF